MSLRSVALEAKASHGLVVYYFGSRAALIACVADGVCQHIADGLSEVTPRLVETAHDPVRFAEVLAHHNLEQMIRDRATGIAIYELNLAGARDEDLRTVLVKWGKVHASVMRPAFVKLGSAAPEADYAFILNTIGGLLVGQLAIPRRNFEKEILRPGVLRIVESLLPVARRSAHAMSSQAKRKI